MLKIGSFLTNICKGVLAAVDVNLKQVREFKTRGTYIRRYGYEYANTFKGGLLPRPDPKIENSPLPMPEYKKVDRWSTQKATFGQNDYIDILGDGNVHPVDLIRGPEWLIGFKGNELQRLSRQMKFMNRELKAKNPQRFHDMNKRIKYLMWRYNFKFGGRKK